MTRVESENPQGAGREGQFCVSDTHPLTAAERKAAQAVGAQIAFDPGLLAWVVFDASDLGAGAPSLRLRPWDMADRDRYLALLNDPEVWRYFPESYPGDIGLSDAEDMIALSASAAHHYVRAIVDRRTIVGQVRADFRAGGGQETELSYWIGREHWGQNYASKAIKIFTEEVFREYPELNQLFARVHPDNGASRRVVEKAGYAAQDKHKSANGWAVFAIRR
ncbi:MAG: GNAT family N-acetyltransferase [Marinovum sp.]|nr:GNAT family N-acetyltransferase [Marinovum sp.]